MAVVRKGVRVGAAACALGLSLAGAGPAAADATESESSESSSSAAVDSDAAPPSVSRSGRVARSASVTTRQRAVAPPLTAVEPSVAVGDRARVGETRSSGASASSSAAARRPAAGSNRSVVLAVTPTNAVDPVVEGAAVSRAAAAPPVSVAATPTVSVASAAAVAAEAPALTAATRVAPRTAQRPTAAAPAAPLDFVNTAVTNWFDSVSNWLSGLPANPVSELLQGGLLLVRRTFFNQAPTVNPYEYMTTPSGQLVGTIDGVDPEADPLTYRVIDAPTFGTLQIGSDGTYTYTPGEGYTGTDSFTVGVDDNRLNVLAPRLGSSPTVATVKVGDTLPGDERYANLVTILNLTGQRIRVTDVRKESGYEDYVEAAPPVGTVLEPGASVFLKLAIAGGDTFFVYSYDTRVVFEPCNTTDCSVSASAVPWIANLTTTGGDDSLGVCEVGECDMYRITPDNPLGIATLKLLPHR